MFGPEMGKNILLRFATFFKEGIPFKIRAYNFSSFVLFIRKIQEPLYAWKPIQFWVVYVFFLLLAASFLKAFISKTF